MAQAPSLQGLIVWLETKDPSEQYDWSNIENLCLIEQYAASIGMPRSELCAFDANGESHYSRLSTNNDCLALKLPHTFGAALERARTAFAKASS